MPFEATANLSFIACKSPLCCWCSTVIGVISAATISSEPCLHGHWLRRCWRSAGSYLLFNLRPAQVVFIRRRHLRSPRSFGLLLSNCVLAQHGHRSCVVFGHSNEVEVRVHIKPAVLLPVDLAHISSVGNNPLLLRWGGSGFGSGSGFGWRSFSRHVLCSGVAWRTR